MISIMHTLAKWGTILWTILCGGVWTLSMIGLTFSQTSPDTEAVPGLVGFFGSLFLFCIWFFPSLFGIIVMYFTRPQAWQTPPPPVPQPAPVQE